MTYALVGIKTIGFHMQAGGYCSRSTNYQMVELAGEALFLWAKK